MKKSIFKKGTSALVAMVMCLSTFFGIGSTTAFAAESTTDEVVMISFPRDGDDNFGGDWGHDELHYMNGWTASESSKITVYTVGSWTGNACYCIEPGTPLSTGDNLTKRDENYWDNYPSTYNSTISADEIKLFIGRIFQYGYTGTVSTSWRSQNADDADKMAHIMATQTLIWETVAGERDSNFNHVDTGSYDAISDRVSTNHPLYSRYISYYNSIASNVQKHSKVPSFCAKSTSKAQNIELEWNGTNYTATLTDTNNVLSQYTFTASESGINFSASGNKLTITAEKAPASAVSITATKNGSVRKGVVVWSDGVITPGSGIQDLTTFTAEVNDPVKGYLNIKVSVGSAKIVKTSEDGKIDGITFTITGNGIDKTVTTNAKGEVQIDNLTPGVYTVTEQNYDKYEPQEVRHVTVVSGQVATVSFNNVLKRGNLVVAKTSEDGLSEGVKFHLYGTSLSGLAVDEYAVTDSSGKAYFNDVLIGTNYTLEEVDTAIRYVIPEKQTAAVEWNEVTNKSFANILKKWNVTVTKSDKETGTAQGNASLAGAVYGIYKGDQLVDTYKTDENGQFTTDYYVCGDDWSIRKITPSEGYLLDPTVYHIDCATENYTIELNAEYSDVFENIINGNISIIKHTDNGSTQIETPEEGAKFEVFLKASGSYAEAKETERDILTCDENGFAQTKDLPYGVYIVHQVSGWDGRELMEDFEVYISKDGATYRYIINNRNFESYIHIVKVDAETGKNIPYAGAAFKLFDPNGKMVAMTFTYPTPTTVDTFYTDENGTLVTPGKLPYGKGYFLVEVEAPYGYVLDSNPVYFDVTEENSESAEGITIIKVNKGNTAQKGTINVTKTGEVFSDVTVENGIYQPVYGETALEGAVFEIRAAEDTGSERTMQMVVQEINQEYQAELDNIKASVTYDTLEMSGSMAVWSEVLSVYSVKVTSDPDNPQEVATITDEKEQILRDIFWEMNTITHSTTTEEVTVIIETDDGNGNILEEEVTETRTTLHITVAHKSADDMALQYSFNADQNKHLDVLLEEGTASMWATVLYGVYGEDDQIVAVALSQIGNVGGMPYWSWYGFGSRVEWCACFVSWCANECGYIDIGVVPKFAGCVNGVQWFKDRGQWADGSFEPAPGMIIFFDWDSPDGTSGPQDGLSDHVGIVQKVEDGRVYTVDGNSGDSCCQKSYPLGYYEILGYGIPAY